MPTGLVANWLDKHGDMGCAGAAEWWPLGMQGGLCRWTEVVELYVVGVLLQGCHR